MSWGPGGSVGYELVSGIPAVRAESDLDFILFATSTGFVAHHQQCSGKGRCIGRDTVLCFFVTGIRDNIAR
jgi:Phosphoribosyl-dephospho-CoA transferase MdcG